MTDEIKSSDKVVLSALACRISPRSIIVLLEILSETPNVVQSEVGQYPVCEGGVDVEAGCDEKIVS